MILPTWNVPKGLLDVWNDSKDDRITCTRCDAGLDATSAKRPKMLMPEIMRSTATRRVPGVMPNLMKATTGRPKVPIKEMMKSTSASRPRIPIPTMNAVTRKTGRNKIR
jgi:hypothetical protein